MATKKIETVTGYYIGLGAIIASAAGASVAVFALFESFLETLVPPIDDNRQTVAFATFGTAILLLTLSLLIQKRLTSTTTRTVIGVCAVLLLCSVAQFGYFRDNARTYVYRFPPASQATTNQNMHIRGELHDRGRTYVGDKTVAQAVFELGGPDFVNSRGLLWSESSRLRTIGKLEMQYIVLAMSLTTALFTAALAIWRMGTSKR